MRRKSIQLWSQVQTPLPLCRCTAVGLEASVSSPLTEGFNVYLAEGTKSQLANLLHSRNSIHGSFSPHRFGARFEDIMLADEIYFYFLLDYLWCSLVYLLCYYLRRTFQLCFFTSAVLFQPHSNPIKREFVLFQYVRKRKN